MASLNGIALDAIEARANYLRTDASDIANKVYLISPWPEWRTRAEAALDKAEAELANALQEVRETKRRIAEQRAKAA